ncbi:MAG: putative rane protein, partial [Daejeonella sp.]|nr:putative rane protein [Daejeonella sp.]
MKKIILALGLLFVLQISAKAQQDAQYTQYMFNSLVINPAYAGYKEALNVGLLARNQWVGFAGTPKTQSFLIDNVFLESKNVGLGLSVVNDKIGDSRQTSAYANYAYRLPVGGEDARLAFGLALGVVQSSIDPSDVRDQADATLMGKQSYFAPDGKLGVFYSNPKFYAGLSAT